MSAFGPKRTSLVAPHMSAFGGKADIGHHARMSLNPAGETRFLYKVLEPPTAAIVEFILSQKKQKIAL